jgi:hypothetical protein
VNRKRENAVERLLFRLSLLALSSFNEMPIQLGETRITCTAFGTGLIKYRSPQKAATALHMR